MTLSSANLVRAGIGAFLAAGAAFFAGLAAFSGTGEAVNWVPVASSTGGAFFATAMAILGFGPGVEPRR